MSGSVSGRQTLSPGPYAKETKRRLNLLIFALLSDGIHTLSICQLWGPASEFDCCLPGVAIVASSGYPFEDGVVYESGSNSDLAETVAVTCGHTFLLPTTRPRRSNGDVGEVPQPSARRQLTGVAAFALKSDCSIQKQLAVRIHVSEESRYVRQPVRWQADRCET